MRWNLRLTAAERGVWKSTEMRRRLADARLGDQRREDVRAVDRDTDHHPPRGPRRHLRRVGVLAHGPAHLRARQGRRPQAQDPGGADEVGWRPRSPRGWDATGHCLRPDARTASAAVRPAGRSPEPNKARRTATTARRGGPFSPPACRGVRGGHGLLRRWAVRDAAIRSGPARSTRVAPAMRGAPPVTTLGCAGPAGRGTSNTRSAYCASCHAVRAIDAHEVCRLCWRNAGRSRGPDHTVDPIGANRHGQQLFFADMHKALTGKGPAVIDKTDPTRRCHRRFRTVSSSCS